MFAYRYLNLGPNIRLFYARLRPLVIPGGRLDSRTAQQLAAIGHGRELLDHRGKEDGQEVA